MWTSRYQLKGKLTGHGDWVNKLLIYNEKYLISCSDDKTIRVKMGVISLYLQIWDLSTEKCISTLNKHQKGVCSLCIMGSTLISGGTDFSIIVLLAFFFSHPKLWNLQTGEPITSLKGHCDVVSSLCVYQNHYLISTDLSSLVMVQSMNQIENRSGI